jgi:hypothetical protein
VKLTANGKSSTQPLLVKMDPRVKTPQDELVRQFELASKLTARLGEGATALEQTHDLQKQIEARKREASSNVELKEALDSLEKKIEVAVEPDSDAEFMLFGLAVPGNEAAPLPRVSGALTGLLVIVESTDAAPTADAASASEKWDAAAQERLARWAALQKEDLASVNALLQKANLKPLALK